MDKFVETPIKGKQLSSFIESKENEFRKDCYEDITYTQFDLIKLEKNIVIYCVGKGMARINGFGKKNWYGEHK